MSKEEEIKYEEDSSNGVLMYIGQVILAIAILYGTGWDIVDGVSQFNLLYLSGITQWKEVIVDSSGLLFALDSKYYGLVIVDRFFDSSFLSWVGFFIAASMVLPFRFFFFSSSN